MKTYSGVGAKFFGKSWAEFWIVLEHFYQKDHHKFCRGALTKCFDYLKRLLDGLSEKIITSFWKSSVTEGQAREKFRKTGISIFRQSRPQTRHAKIPLVGVWR